MSNYTKSTSFTPKDSYPPGDPRKIIKGEEFDDEFDSIEIAINDNASDILALEAFRSAITASTAELNNTAGTTSNIQAQIDSLGSVWTDRTSRATLYDTENDLNDGGFFFNNQHSAIFAQADGSQAYPFIYFYLGGSSIGSIVRNGFTGVSYNTSSDYRLKENVVPVANAVERVKDLNPCRFNFIGEERIVDGFLAHEAQQVVPESVTGDKDAVDDEGNPMYQGIDQSKLVPLLTAALQEAIARIEALEGGA